MEVSNRDAKLIAVTALATFAACAMLNQIALTAKHLKSAAESRAGMYVG
jgi:hypothetical protein